MGRPPAQQLALRPRQRSCSPEDASSPRSRVAASSSRSISPGRQAPAPLQLRRRRDRAPAASASRSPWRRWGSTEAGWGQRRQSWTSAWGADDMQSAEPSRRDVYFVGVCGPSGSGKTTLARSLAIELGSPVKPIGMDWFLNPKWMPVDPKFGEKNWETPDGVDFARLASELHALAETLRAAPQVPSELLVGGRFGEDVVQPERRGQALGADSIAVVVEGFLLFYDEALAKDFRVKFWLEADCEVCLQRRQKRGRKRARNPDAASRWFREQVWEHYERNRPAQLRNAPSAVKLDAKGDKANVVAEAVAVCRKLPALATGEDRSGGRRRGQEDETDGHRDSAQRQERPWSRSGQSRSPWPRLRGGCGKALGSPPRRRSPRLSAPAALRSASRPRKASRQRGGDPTRRRRGRSRSRSRGAAREALRRRPS
eukprot:TRINITY_DN19387_c0_g1_i1.p1 TRINITY_DN19387_c0_g1~~TRINITY_DN19387_c0_g1_i1.p1  ORF type:complete len:439 (-),score=73.87 TRINITY_DN19387_c0_g1_i1:59-1342(-)